jgi:quercetin dioxygenase-like cupin family protein
MPNAFINPEDLFLRQLSPGVSLALAWGERIMLSKVTIEPGGVVPRHSHPHEQAGVCLSGEFELEVDGLRRVVRPGDLYLIPGGVPHSARGTGVRSVVLDVFSPPREDYKPGATPALPSR